MRLDYDTLRKVLVGLTLVFMAVGVALAVLGPTSLLDMWSERAAATFVAGKPSAGFIGVRDLTYGILGGSIAGKWAAAFWLAHEPLRRRERWAWHASWAGLLTWFVFDSSLSFAFDCAWNVVMINLLAFVTVGATLLAMRPGLDPPRPRISSPANTVIGVFSALMVVVGVVVGLANHSILFAPYNQLLYATYYGEVVPGAGDLAFSRFMFGLIGATFTAHFVMLAAMGFWARAEDARWVARAFLSSVVVWFGVDSAMCLMRDGVFNVLIVNVPCLLAAVAAWAWARRSAVPPTTGVS